MAKPNTKSAPAKKARVTAVPKVAVSKIPVSKLTVSKATASKTATTKLAAKKVAPEPKKKIVAKTSIPKPLSVEVDPVEAAIRMAPPLKKPASVLEDLDFKTEDKVVYPAHGVGVVDSIQIRKVSGAEQKFYMITIIESGMKIMVPVGQSKTVGLRRVVDHKTVEKVYDILRDRKVQLDTQTWNRRYREYSQKIKTGSVLEIARVIRDLSVLKSDKELSFGERRMLDTAQGLLVKEISIAKASPEDTVKEELQQLCQVSF